MGFSVRDKRGVRLMVSRATAAAGLMSVVLVVSLLGLAEAQPLTGGQDTRGLFPVVFNLATRARISANATCGERQPEVFCKLVEHVQIFPAENRHCDICDARSEQPLQRHPIQNAIDGSHRWWQSPTLTNGNEYNHVTITLDLGSIYQVAYVIVKAANSPRPGNWILERSLDGQTYKPWQYFAMTDDECMKAYGVRATVGTPSSLGDDEVICTSKYSKLDPLENGEIFVSIVNGRPGVFQPSRVLLDFTSARYVQLRLQRIRTLNADLMFFEQFRVKDLDPSVTRRYFYSVKDISIGGQCICYGHATFCRRHDSIADRWQCQCQHNTGGDNCEECLPLFNQRPWRTGGIQGLGCEACNCHGKAAECVYNATVDSLGLSLNKEGQYSGGGVCLNCQEFTTGINCEKCIDGYYRPRGYSPTAPMPCRRCSCRETSTSTSQCVPDDSRIDEGLNPGDCVCKPGFGGPSCRECAYGYSGFPNCQPCSCNPAGSVSSSSCRQPCNCKTNVGGQQCNECRPGFYNLDRNNPRGCTECFCFGVTTLCRSADWGLTQISDLDGWTLSTLKGEGLTLLPRFFDGWLEAKTYLLSVNSISPSSTQYTPSDEVHYWLAPMTYLGNRLSSYGGRLKYTVKYTLDNNLVNRGYLAEPDLILKGGNMTIAYGREYKRENLETMVSRRLTEDGWYHIQSRRPVSRQDFMTILYKLEQLMIKATYHGAQDTTYLRDISLEVASPLVMSNRTLPSVEQCQCPEGYAGLSCESCSPGWRRVNEQLYAGVCQRCNCNSHAAECDPYTGACQSCKHNTAGANCDKCPPGFYGDPSRGTENDCQPCACPLVAGNNFFAASCVANPAASGGYQCVNCQEGYEGQHCERCAPGYYGNPNTPGGFCRKCNCGGNIDPSVPGSCDSLTGACNICANNTEGAYCERCRSGYYGSARNGDCRPCACSPEGSSSNICDQRTGQCSCRSRFVGRQCDRCQPGYGDTSQGCIRCSCSSIGSVNRDCDPVTGRCRCRPGVGGRQCEHCREGHFGYSQRGCQRCNCYSPGTNNGTQCEPRSGRCLCLPNVIGQRCDQCLNGYYGIDSRRGCVPCNCDQQGSTSYQCDQRSGQCSCRQAIGGRACNRCLPGYFGFSSGGCQRCQPCTRPGYICDPYTGECVCPPNTEGPNCERCANHAYDHQNGKGCKRCNCTIEGSASQQCDLISGVCTCLPGFHGFSCESCLSGYYSFPDCDACNCNPNGSEPESCSNGQGLCECDYRGQCQCKVNVEGEQCDECAPGTFSLVGENPKGCTECYCFLRSQVCGQAPYVWSTVTVPTMRAEITPLALEPVVDVGGYLVINSSKVAVDPALSSRPLYWSMPEELLGDKTISYAGRLEFIHYFDRAAGSTSRQRRAAGQGRAGRNTSRQGLSPMIVLQGNTFELHGELTTLEPNHPETFVVKFYEDFWRIPGQDEPVSRRLLMVVLQNVTAILIRATQDGQATFAEIGPITMQVSVPSQDGNSSDIAYGVEQCVCPERYSGLSCQNPAEGYYRKLPNPSINIQTPETAIGYVRPCQCYSHSNSCHPETGVCKDCMHNTTGDNCEQCAPGFYGLATRGSPYDCAPCACPLPEPSNNFSPTCSGVGSSLMCTNCSQGYTGTRCERCAPGYYGNPAQLGEKCQPCDCDPEGTVENRCDRQTGQCQCRPGISGQRCDRCPDPQQGVQNGVCVSCYEGCTGELLDDLKNLTIPSSLVNVTGVVYPFEDLYRLDNETKELRARMDALNSTSVAEMKKIRDQVEFYNNIANNLHNRTISVLGTELNFTNSRMEKVKDKANETMVNAIEVEKIVDELFKEIRGNISQLRQLVEKLYYNQTGLNVTAALQEARKILDTILARNFTDADMVAKEEGLKAEMLSEQVKNMRRRLVNTTRVAQALNKTYDALRDLYNQTAQARDKAIEVIDERSQRLGSLIADLEDKKLDLQEMTKDTEDMIKEGKDLNTDAETAISRLTENLLTLQTQLFTLNAAKRELERQFNILKTAMPGLEQLYQDAWKHALDLDRMATQMADLFEKVRNLAADPMQAARAYQSIVQAISQAEAAAKEALRAAEDSVRIAGVKDLKDKVNATYTRSNELLKRADNLFDLGIRDLAAALDSVKKDLDDTEKKHESAADLLAMLLDGLDEIPKGFSNRLDIILRKIDLAVDRANEANLTVDNIQYGIDTLLLPKLKQLQDFDINAIIYKINASTADARDNADMIKNNLTATKESGQRSMREVLDLSDKISDLRRKINQARNLTNSMKMSLMGRGNCVRSYRSQLTPGVTNEIRLGVKLNRTGVDMLLLLLQESADEYLALEIKDNKVRFSWNVGKEAGSVLHDLELKVFDVNADEGEKWYRILAKRVGPIGKLKVWAVKGSEASAKELSGRSTSGTSLISLNRNTSIFIAGVEASHQVPAGVTKGKLYGCIGDVSVDGKPIGVYNFKTSEGKCSACSNVPKVPPSTSVYSFDGNGYADLPITRLHYQAERFAIMLEFKTFWENSRLFFAGNPQSGDFVSIDLVGGRILVQFYLGGMSEARVETSMTYNTNQWTTISLQRRKLDAILETFVDEKSEENLQFSAAGPNTGLEIMGQSMYIGGLPSNFRIEKFTKKDYKDNRNFVGCMRNIAFGGFSPIPQDLSSAGTLSPGCRDTSLRQVGLFGTGYVMFDGVTLGQPEAEISLSFFTKQEDALLLLGRDFESDYFYSIALKDGYLEARLAANSAPTVLRSPSTFNDGALHYVALLKNDRSLQMLVDDVVVATGELPVGVNEIPLGINSSLFFGGSSIKVNDMAASSDNLDGCISDIIVNGRLVDLNLAKQYKEADIGRCRDSVTYANGETANICENGNFPTGQPLKPLPTRAMTRSITTNPTPPVPTTTPSSLLPTSTCSPFRMMNAGIESNAKTLGNSVSSYAQISNNIRRNELRRSFNITFEFRTFFANGMFGLLKNQNQSVYFVAQLKNGQVEVVYSFKGQRKTLTSSGFLADGQWHSVQIIKDRTRLLLEVDGGQVGPGKIESRLEIDLPLYIGSVPPKELKDLTIDVVKHSLRGCVRNLHLGGRPVDITDTDIISGVEHCYVNVEPGVGFTTDSSGIYDLAFDVGQDFIFEAEFKTSKKDGVLFTISSMTEDIGFTLELYNGKVLLTLKNEDEMISVDSANIDPNEFCMNQWHKVQAGLFNGNTLRLKVDQQRDQFETGKFVSTVTPSNSALMIGGIHPTFTKQPASSSERGLYGCMRDVSINGYKVDWYKLEISNSLLRTGCPL